MVSSDKPAAPGTGPSTSGGGTPRLGPELQYVRVVRREGYAVLAMAKEPVNSLNLDMWRELEAALDGLEADTSCQGVIITSALKRDVFSAGNDIMELFAPRTSGSRYAEFWVTSNRFLCKLYGSRLATIAAIRGASPAGGCMMSLCCDHRVITSNGTLGLNEVQLGIPVPKYWAALMVKVIGHKAAEKLLLTGKMVGAAEAKTLGMVDAVVDKDGLLPAAEKVMTQLVRLPSTAVAATKANLRADFCQEWSKYYLSESIGGWEQLQRPETVAMLEVSLARLASGSAKKAADAAAAAAAAIKPTPKL
ncbi:hypothetical protein QJQ45_029607 [Haematococcus lacustris]|nr:hypothetical protein QJQ45_029607 [Haematococcus lacustris]